jgi:uncharacterized protein (TIGR02996 family)
MPQPGYEPFLRAICARPDDDTPRLAYADWLDENGDSDRAEFIRCQIAAAAEPHDTRPQKRAKRLFRQHRGNWLAELPQHDGLEWAGAFTRGFAYSVYLRGTRKLDAFRDQVFAAAPVTHASLLYAGPTDLAALLAVPGVERLQYLRLQHCHLADDDWRVLTECPHLANVRWLRVEPGYDPAPWDVLTVEGARLFAGSPGLTRLEWLDLQGPVTDAAAAVLRGRFKLVSFQPRGR